MTLPQTCLDDIFQCISYLLIMPIFMVCGLVGSVATFFVLTGTKFNTNTFFYLKALSLSDLMYLIAAFGYIYEIFFLQNFSTVNSVIKYYLTHFDVLLCNTFIGTSGFIIVLVTIDRWRCICSPTTPESTKPGLYCVLALLVSFIWQLPRVFMKTLKTDCIPLHDNIRFIPTPNILFVPF